MTFLLQIQLINPKYSGNIDGFVRKYNSQNGNILASTYIGDGGFNQCYFCAN